MVLRHFTGNAKSTGHCKKKIAAHIWTQGINFPLNNNLFYENNY